MTEMEHVGFGAKAKEVLGAVGRVVTHSTGIHGATKGWKEVELDIAPSGEVHAIDRGGSAILGALEELGLPHASREMDLTLAGLDLEAKMRGISQYDLMREIDLKGLLEFLTTFGSLGAAVIGVLANNPEIGLGALGFLAIRNLTAQAGWEIYHSGQPDIGDLDPQDELKWNEGFG